jgi:hypothetical protein
VSVDAAGQDANGFSSNAMISGNGRYVVFNSQASDIVSGDDGVYNDIYVRDLQTATTTKVSVNTNGGNANGDSAWPAITADGRYVSFSSTAGDLVAGDLGAEDIFVRDLQTGTTTLVTVTTDGLAPSSNSFLSAISDDGRFVAFESFANNLVPGDTGSHGLDIFVRDRTLGTTTGVTTSLEQFASSGAPAISSDGRYIAFDSNSTELDNENTSDQDIFVYDRTTGTTERASVSSSGGDNDGGFSNTAAISNDGRYVAFQSRAADLVTDDTNGSMDIFIRDRSDGVTRRVSVGSFGQQADGDALVPAISGDGHYVAFTSYATNLVGNDENGAADVFVRYVQQPEPTGITPNAVGRGASATLTIAGRDFVAGATVRPGAGITVDSVDVVSQTRIDVEVTVAANASVGARGVWVDNVGGGPGPAAGSSGLCGACLTVT